MNEVTTEAERRALLERLFAAFNRHDAVGAVAVEGRESCSTRPPAPRRTGAA